VKILVTGSTGFIGSHIVNRLVHDGCNVVILKRSTSDTSRITEILSEVKSYDLDKCDLKTIIEKEKPYLIVHTATCYGRQGENIEHIIKSNIIFPSILIDIAAKNGLKGFINADTSTLDTYSFYAATKKAFLHLLNYQRKFKTINLQIEYAYGPGDDETKLLPFLIKGVLENNSISASPGLQKRDFIFVEDVVDAFIKSINYVEKMPENYIHIEIGTGDSISFRDVISILERITSKKSSIKWGALDYRKNEIFELRADIKRANELMGWYPKYKLEKGLRKIINDQYN